jgi:hypothetical protein
MTCGEDAAGNFRCLEPPDQCGTETVAGRCDGNRAVWCEDGEVRTVPCWTGSLCGDGGDGRMRCVDECELIGREGRCDGAVARWCEEGVVRERDCGACGQACAWIDDSLGFYCL